MWRGFDIFVSLEKKKSCTKYGDKKVMRLLQGSCFCVKSYIVLIALGLGLCAEALQERCYNGQILLKDSNGYYVCVPCPNNTFMSEHEHNHTECYSCSTVKHPELEVEISKCNTTHDAEIGCKHGYYRNKSSSTCIECSVCDNGLFERQECRAYSDTVCCGEKAHIVVVVSGKQLCKMPHCGAGLYLNRTAEKCIECPNNKYMPSTNHTQEECLPCITDVDPESHQVITHHCNRTHQALVECDDGFYGKGQHVNGKPDCYYCTPATVNSACCSYRNMPFVPGLPECQSVTSEPPPETNMTTETADIFCGVDEYLETKNRSCRQCPAGTFMDKINHTSSSCKNYTEVRQENSSDDGGFGAGEISAIVVTLLVVIIIAVIIIDYVRLKRAGEVNNFGSYFQRFFRRCRRTIPDRSGPQCPMISKPSEENGTKIDSTKV